MPREDDDFAVVEDGDDMNGVEIDDGELDPKDEAKVVTDDEPELDEADEARVDVTGDGRAPNEQPATVEPTPPAPEPKAEDKPKPTWDKEKQREDQRKARQERSEMRETIARLNGELEGIKTALARSPNATPEQKAEIKSELDDVLAQLAEQGDLVDPNTAKAFKILAQSVKTLQAENIELKTTSKSLRETEDQRKAREQKDANDSAYDKLVEKACKKDEALRNQLLEAMPAALEHYGYAEDSLPDAKVTAIIIDAVANDIRAKQGKPAAPAPAPKPAATRPVAVPPPPKPQPRRAMSLREKAADIAKNGYRFARQRVT